MPNKFHKYRNYNYDEEGRLVKDSSERINKIVWRVDGKVKEIQRMTGSTKWLKFDYDAMGNRIAKHVYNNTGTTHERSTYYILDAQGNQISTYDHEIVGGSAKFHLKERNIFGSSRIGSKQDSLNVLTATLTQNYTQVLGTKYYEFSNHLGNVLTVFSDVKIALDQNSDNQVDGFRVPIRNISDYSPFGVQLDGRTISMDNYRYGFQNQEKDDEIKGAGNSVNYKYRMHDSRVGRFFAVDPLVKSYPELTSYQFSSNSPIFMVELEGKEGKITVTTKWYTDKGIQKSKSKTYTVEGLKADIIKICWKGYNNGAGPVVEIDYFGRAEDGTRLGGLTHVNPDAKPTVKELNAIFASDAMNSYNVKEKEKEAAIAKKENENWYDGTVFAPGALEGGDDGLNNGNNAASRQAPAALKVIAGLCAPISIPNSYRVLKDGVDIYGVESTTNTDKGLAILNLVTLGGTTSLVGEAFGASVNTVDKLSKLDNVNTVIQAVNDSGSLDSIKK